MSGNRAGGGYRLAWGVGADYGRGTMTRGLMNRRRTRAGTCQRQGAARQAGVRQGGVRGLVPLMVPLMVLCSLLGGGCVKREMVINSEPQGALVYLNDLEVGRTPVTRPFVFYGTYDVVLRKEGYETLKAEKLVLAPWWQWVPFDLVAEAFPLTDRHKLEFKLSPATTRPADPQELLGRAEAMKAKLPSTQATTRP